MKKWFYERGTELLESPVNKRFEEVLAMTDAEFVEWCAELRRTVVKLWDEKGQPPRVGYDAKEMAEQYQALYEQTPYILETVDEMTGEQDVLRNTTSLGNATNQFFPTMMKTRINYTKNGDGKSIYDYFAKKELFDSFCTYARRHFKRDSFYHYSNPISFNDLSNPDILPISADDKDAAKLWVKQFNEFTVPKGNYGFWLAPRDADEEYTGYDEKLRARKNLYITRKEIESLGALIPDYAKSNMRADQDSYQIRVFEYGQRLFPVGLKAFRVSYCQYAVNFPPLTAKYLYEKYTEHCRDQERIVVYDPSAGWAGRITGAMTVANGIPLHYVGTDPNTDHNTENGRTKYHEVADFINANISRGKGLFKSKNTYEIFQLGSEVIGEDKGFQKYKGKVDLVFTSPPYFAKEVYSDDPTQSCHKFSQYETWRDGFLRPTLETAVEWLKKDRYLLWNIADAQFGGDMLPLEKDSRDILESLGMKYKGKLKMSLAQMPGGNRVDPETGLPRAKNFCKVNGIWLKYEPIFVFYKE